MTTYTNHIEFKFPLRSALVPALALSALAVLLAVPCNAQFQEPRSILGSETVTIDIAPSALANNYVQFGNNPSLDAGQTAQVPIIIAVAGLAQGTQVTLNLSATAGDPATGAPGIGYTFSLNVLAGSPIQIPIAITATTAKPGGYQLFLTATDAATNKSSSTPPRGILITTPAAGFKSMSASTHMAVSVTGTQILLKAMALGEGTGLAQHFRMIFHNMGTSTLRVSSGPSSFLLAPADVLAADFSTQFDVVASVFDGSTGSLEIGFP